MTKDELKAIYEKWAREEIEVVELLDAVARFVNKPADDQPPGMRCVNCGDTHSFKGVPLTGQFCSPMCKHEYNRRSRVF